MRSIARSARRILSARSCCVAVLSMTVCVVSARVLKVVTTTEGLAAIAREVGGSNASVSSLIVGARDPHRIEAKPSYMSRVSSADLFIAIGLELEIGYENAILQGSRNSRVYVGAPGHVYASDWVQVLEKPLGRVDRSMGDIHPFGNPHIWLDPYNGRVIALRLAEKMAELDPPDAAAFRANAKTFAGRIDNAMFGSQLVQKHGAEKLWTWVRSHELLSSLKESGTEKLLGGWAGQMAAFVGSPVITYHRSMTYFINRFGLISAGELEPKPGIDPTPSHVGKVIETVKSRGIKALIQEPIYSTRNAEFIASRTGAKVVVIPGDVGADPAAKDYISFFDTVVSRIAGALKG
jgi:zinc/manganese transport system substrate-binding protein